MKARFQRFRLLILSIVSVLAAGTAAVVPSQPAAATGGSALFGMFPGANNIAQLGPPSWTQMDDYLFPGMIPWQGRGTDVINIYNQIHGTGGVDQVVDSYLPVIWDDIHAVPLISLNTNNWTNAQILDGSGDADINYYADKVSNWLKVQDSRGVPAPTGGRRIYIRLDWEMNANFSPWAPPKSATTCDQLLANEAQYVQMWRYFHDKFMTRGGFSNTQVQWVYSIYQSNVFNPVYATVLSNCVNGASNVVGKSYPGDAYVDWVGSDGYAYNLGTPFATPASTFDWAFNQLAATAPTKPLSVNEVGVCTHQTGQLDRTPAEKAAWISSYFSYIQTKNVKMSLWFNIDLGAQNQFHNLAVFDKANNAGADPYGDGDSTFTGTDGKKYNAYSTYKTGISSSYFISPDLANQRLLTDAQFQGA